MQRKKDYQLLLNGFMTTVFADQVTFKFIHRSKEGAEHYTFEKASDELFLVAIFIAFKATFFLTNTTT
ncbi:hypothetical protein ACZ98_06915 [Vibrio parahaemolyticus]|nr:hypothetical protein ACZ98_06915 [Vibrio parahaemolyticus]KOH22900.1 hypothetical protein ACZ92_04745 [Vibrio parahaemolyticus]ODX32324.1 hypothetical protein BBM01_14495 [Vibrio parahaemolyticus]